MKYKYQARTNTGELQVGFVDAADRDTAINILAGHQLFVLAVEAVGGETLFSRVASFFGRVRRKDLMIFTRQMATLIEARLPLTDVLKTLYEQTNQLALKESVFQVSQDIDSGLALSQALERQPQVFSEFFVSMVRSAEVTGNLEKVVGFLADYLEKETILISKARSAMIYPGIILGLFVVVAFIMVSVVFPQIAPVFDQAGVQLPFFTRTLIAAGQFVARTWFIILALLGLGIFMFSEYLGTAEGRAFKDDLKIRTPLVRRVYLPLTLVRMANTASMLLKGGVPMAQALEIVGDTIDNVLYRDLLREVSQSVRQGERLAMALSRNPKYFPPLLSQMVAVGETTGQVDQIFTRIGEFYGREADSIINNLVDLLQPVLMIGIGLLVGILFASILLPLYQLTASVQ